MMDEKEEYQKRKRDMMELWRKTFHDSRHYIDLVFDTYFNLDNTFVRYDGDRLIAALLGVQYAFIVFDKFGKRKTIQGLYLCGLATEQEWRRKGIMSQLMEEAEITAKTRGCQITFLIPADEHLREYYRKRGYVTSSYRRQIEFHRTSKSLYASISKMNIYTIRDFPEKGEFLIKLAEECRKIELNRKHPTIVHSTEDFLAIISENENSFFLTESSFDPEYPILAKVRAIVFPEFSDHKTDTMRIVGFYDMKNLIKGNVTSDLSYEDIEQDITESIFLKFGFSRIEFLIPFEWDDDKNGEVVPYAMIKFLESKESFSINEKRNFEISLMLD